MSSPPSAPLHSARATHIFFFSLAPLLHFSQFEIKIVYTVSGVRGGDSTPRWEHKEFFFSNAERRIRPNLLKKIGSRKYVFYCPCSTKPCLVLVCERLERRNIYHVENQRETSQLASIGCSRRCCYVSYSKLVISTTRPPGKLLLPKCECVLKEFHTLQMVRIEIQLHFHSQ